MTRYTKASLQKALLNGEAVRYQDGSKNLTLQLVPESRKLFEFLLGSPVREPKDIPKAFIDGLWLAYSAGGTAAAVVPQAPVEAELEASRVWRIERLVAKNFGGLNVFGGEDFVWDLRGESWLIDGENGSGKSSLLGAIAWAFTGNRPRDEAAVAAHIDADVHDASFKKIGTWPPLAAYPSSASSISNSPEVEVTVHLRSEDGQTAVVQRALRAGKIHSYATVAFDDVFVATGIEMPLVLPTLRIKDKGEGALTRAVSQLTGLEDLVAIGELAEGLCHGAREYCSFSKKSGLAGKRAEFDAKVAEAQEELKAVGQQLSKYTPADGIEGGAMSTAIESITRSATSLAGSLAADLADGIEVSSLETQRDIIVALRGAEEAIARGLGSIAEWRSLDALTEAATNEAAKIDAALDLAEKQIREVVAIHESQVADDRYRLKAIGAHWHSEHRGGAIINCPLCDQGLSDRDALRAQLESLRATGEESFQTLKQNVVEIERTLTAGLPAAISAALQWANISPRDTLISAVRREIGSGAKFGMVLRRYAALIDDGLMRVPATDLPVEIPSRAQLTLSELEPLTEKLNKIRQLIRVAEWFRSARLQWVQWWEQIAGEQQGDPGSERTTEGIRVHLARLSDAMDGAKPYARAATSLAQAALLGSGIREIEAEQRRREDVVTALQPIKQLTAVARFVAREAIDGLSGRIQSILNGMHTVERFRYRAATIQKKDGLVVQGSFEPEFQIDATLVANTSWIRSTLWAFVFALRHEAVEQFGSDPFPVWLFDDPQSTFDIAHRLNWASYVASLQSGNSAGQVVIATHDESFAAKLRQSELHAREGLLKAATTDSGAATVLEGSSVERYWAEAVAEPSSKSRAVAYLSEARVFLEGMLRAMLAGQGADINGKSIGDLRQRMLELAKEHRSPWDKKEFGELTKLLENPVIKFIHQSHHADRHLLTFAEAKAVSAIWPNLARLVNQCYREIRDHRLLHGLPSVFQLAPPSIDFPNGFGSVIAKTSFRVLGRASAFSGRISEGTLEYEEYDATSSRGVRLAQHGAFRLGARTMEPVARAGDILLVHDFLGPEFRSFVVAVVEDQVVARRYVVSEASSDVIVLAANALDPFEIAAPIVARKEAIKARRVVGVLFDRSASFAGTTEVGECASESELNSLLSRCTGLVEVVGQSAQPLALDGQYLLLGEKVPSESRLGSLDGKPVIALDSEDAHYFKRLRLGSDGLVILESLDGGGDFPPEVLWQTVGHSRRLVEAWEVLGVLFEKP